MIIKTNNLDRAAFLTCFGGVMVEILERYPNNVFCIHTNRLVSWYEKVGGWIPYNRFCNERRKWKRKARKLAGLPEHFTGDKDSHIKLGDIALVWSRKT